MDSSKSLELFKTTLCCFFGGHPFLTSNRGASCFKFLTQPKAGGCLLVHSPKSKPPAFNIVLACGAVAAMQPWARLILSTLFLKVEDLDLAKPCQCG